VELAEQAGSFIHELKNHINTLSLHVQLLAEDLEVPETPRERRAVARVRLLHGECERLVALSQDYLRFTRVDTPTLVRTPLPDVVQRLVDFLHPTAKAQQIDIVLHEAANLPPVQLDPEFFDRALLNLMLNAQEAMEHGGTLTLQARREADCVALDVIDTGCGIPPELVDRLFRPFFTTKPGGSGLGLAIARKQILALGGTLTVQSQPECGSLFTITLPIAEEA